MTPYQFFYQNAGYSWDPKTESREQGRRRCAKQYAEAEKRATELGFSFEWQVDPDIDSSEWSDDPEPWATWLCIMRDDTGTVRNSCGGVDFGRDGAPWGSPYRRVMEAELATGIDP